MPPPTLPHVLRPNHYLTAGYTSHLCHHTPTPTTLLPSAVTHAHRYAPATAAPILSFLPQLTSPASVLTEDWASSDTRHGMCWQSSSRHVQEICTGLRMAREVPVSRNSTESWQEQFPTGDPLLCSQRRVAQAPADSPIFAEHTGVGVRGRHFTDIPFFFPFFSFLPPSYLFPQTPPKK